MQMQELSQYPDTGDGLGDIRRVLTATYSGVSFGIQRVDLGNPRFENNFGVLNGPRLQRGFFKIWMMPVSCDLSPRVVMDRALSYEKAVKRAIFIHQNMTGRLADLCFRDGPDAFWTALAAKQAAA